MILCDNIHCKFNSKKTSGKNNGKRYCAHKGDIIIDSGKCDSFERSITWYFNKVWNATYNTNMIPVFDLDDDLKIGLYYVMKCYNLGFVFQNRGSWQWLSLCDPDTQETFSYKQIIERPFDSECFNKLLNDYMNGIIAGTDAWYEKENEEKPEPPKKNSQPYGILSPSGRFVEGEFGDHEQLAWDIVEENGWHEDLFEKGSVTASDYLVNEKRYVIIHCPTGEGGYMVTSCPYRPLTNAQRDFLYQYFYDMGDRMRAEFYLEEK